MIGMNGIADELTLILILSIIGPVLAVVVLGTVTRRILRSNEMSSAKKILIYATEFLLILGGSCYFFGPVYRLYLGL